MLYICIASIFALIAVCVMAKYYGWGDIDWVSTIEKYEYTAPRINFKKFIKLYDIIPDRWKLRDGYLEYYENCRYQIVLLDTYSDFKKYRKWYKKKVQKEERIIKMEAMEKREQNQAMFNSMWDSELSKENNET